MRENMESLYELWKLMDTSEEERRHFVKLARYLDLPEQNVTHTGSLSCETIEQVWELEHFEFPLSRRTFEITSFICGLNV